MDVREGWFEETDETTWPPAEVAIASRGRTAATLGLLLVAGVLCDLSLRAGIVGIGPALVAVTSVAAFAVAASSRRVWSLALGGAAVCVAGGTAIRANGAVVFLDVVTATSLLALAAGYARGGDPTELAGPDAARRVGRAIGAAILAPGRVRRNVVAVLLPPSREWNMSATTRIALGVTPVLLVLGVLLLSADPVLASWFDGAQSAEAFGHVVLSVVGAIAVASFVVLAVQQPTPLIPVRKTRLQLPEAWAMLGGLVVLYGLFAAAQGAALAGGDRYVRDTTGLTYSDYARAGFFQLIAAAAITVSVLVALRARVNDAPPNRRGWLLALGLTAIALTLVSVAVALHRLDLYADEFGLTIDRFFATAAAWWVGTVLVIVAIAFVGVGRLRAWLVPAIVATSVVWVGAITLINPEGYVMERNLDRAARGEPLDLTYARFLSADGLSVLGARLDDVPPSQVAEARAVVCTSETESDSIVAWNLGRSRIADARARVCRTTVGP